MALTDRQRKILFATLVASLSALPFLQAIGFPFLLAWDDLMLVNAEPLLKFNAESILYWLQGNYCKQLIPVTFFSFIADYSIDGLNPAVFHVQNLLWHAIACAGVYMCFTLFNIRPWLAFALALAYAIHPQKAESAAWIMERKDVLFGAFAAWSFYFYAKGSPERRFAPLSLCLFVISLLSKPTAISFPAVLLFFEMTRARPFNIKAMAIRLAPFFALSAILAVSTLRHSDDVVQNPFLLKVFISARNLLWYVWSTIAPLDLLPLYPRVEFTLSYAAPTFLAYLCIAAGAAFLLANGRKDFLLWRAIPLAGAFAMAHITTIGLVQFNGVDYADRYNYMPSAFVCFAIAWLLSRLLDGLPEDKAKKAAPAAAAILSIWLLTLLWLAFIYCKVFSSSLSVFTVATLPEKPNIVATWMLAVEKFKSNIPGAGKDLYDFIMATNPCDEDGAKDRADMALAKFLMAAEAIQKGGAPDEIEHNLSLLRKFSVAKYPNRFVISKLELLNILLDAQLKVGAKEEALESLRRLIEESRVDGIPDNRNASMFYYAGMKHFLAENYVEAAASFQKALEISPNSELFKRNLKSAIEMRDAKK